MSRPIAVTIGTRAFRSTCPWTTAALAIPLARAVRTWSSYSTSSTDALVSRDRVIASGSASVSAGRTRNLSSPSGSRARSPRCPGGNQPSVTANSRIMQDPSQKLGTASPRLVIQEIAQSTSLRCLTAAITPSGSAIRIVMNSAAMASSIVGRRALADQLTRPAACW